jgi:hypothetical protein
MRGDDLSPLLLGQPADPALRAFASTDGQHMWSDGQLKLVCGTGDKADACRLYDLAGDPRETRDVSADKAAETRRLRHELSELVASLPRVEALAMEGGSAFPRALTRARLGDVSAAPELLPLLGDAQAAVRAEAAASLGRLHYAQALHVLDTLRAQDADAHVRDEAALATYVLGGTSAEAQLRELVARPAEGMSDRDRDVTRRAALSLPLAKPSFPHLLALARDDKAAELARKQALAKLGDPQARPLLPQLLPLLDAVRLRSAVVDTLAAIGGRSATSAIAARLEEERYVDARRAEVCALARLRDSRTKRLLLRFLGTETGVPSGVTCYLAAFGPLETRAAVLTDVRAALADGSSSWLGGEFSCDAASSGCVPGKGASLQLGARAKRDVRVVFEADVVGPDQHVQLGDELRALPPGRSTAVFSVARTAGGSGSRALALPISASAGVVLVALAVVAQSDDIPPPPPEPYDAGVDDSEGSLLPDAGDAPVPASSINPLR